MTPLQDSLGFIASNSGDEEGRDTALQAVALIRFAEMATVTALRVPWPRLRNPSRGPRRESLARQISIYLPRLIWGFEPMDLSRSTGRERSTIRHACACIAQARGCRPFDLQLVLLEQAIRHGIEATLAPISAERD